MVNVIKLVHKQLKIFRKLSSIESNFEAPKSNTDSDDEICSFANFVLWKSTCEFLLISVFSDSSVLQFCHHIILSLSLNISLSLSLNISIFVFLPLFFKIGPFPASFFFFTSFQCSWMVHLNFANDLIRTADLWCRKRPLYQLRHNHFPSL